MAQSKWIYGGGAVLLAGLIVWAVTSVPEIPQQTDEPTGPRIMSYMDNTLHEERDGRTVWQMTAEQMNVDIDTNDTGMVKIDGTFYSDDGRTLTLKADEGRMDSKTRDIVLTGTIEATTSDGAHLRAKEVKWTAAEGELSAEGDAEFVRDDIRATGDRIVSTDNFQRFSVIGKKLIKIIGNSKLFVQVYQELSVEKLCLGKSVNLTKHKHSRCINLCK